MNTEKLKVLIVDDSPEDAELVTDALAGSVLYDYQCQSIHDAQSALHELKYQQYDVVLLDYNMPGNDGLWVLSELQVECLSVPIIFMTGSGDERVAVKALKLGATDYVCKVDLDAINLEESILYSLKRKQEDIEFLERATRDPLTSTMTRFTFMETLQQTVNRSERNSNRFAVLFIDLDKFKPINDTYGHYVGDQVLIESSKRISAGMRKCDSLARLGGDEFVMLVEDLGDEGPSNAAIVANRVYKAITELAYHYAESKIYLGASIGVAIYPECGSNASELLGAADEAMYECKRASKGGFVYHKSCRHLLTPPPSDRAEDICVGAGKNIK